MNVPVKFRRHVGQIKLQISPDLPGNPGPAVQFRSTRDYQYRSPVERTNALVADLQHVAGFGAVDVNGADDRVRPVFRIAQAQLGQSLDRNPRLQLIQKVRPGVGIADGIAGIDFQDGLQVVS